MNGGGREKGWRLRETAESAVERGGPRPKAPKGGRRRVGPEGPSRADQKVGRAERRVRALAEVVGINELCLGSRPKLGPVWGDREHGDLGTVCVERPLKCARPK